MAGIGMQAGPSELKLLSWNVRGLNNAKKCKQVIQYMQRHAVDIACLQETHLAKPNTSQFARGWGPHRYFSNYSGYARGVAILIHNRIPFQLLSLLLDPEGRYVILHGRMMEHIITIVSVYAPNNDCPEFFHSLQPLLSKYRNWGIVLGGDLNILLSTELDSSKSLPHSKPRALKALSELCSDLALVDRWRQSNPNTRTYTHYSGQHDTWTRLDYWLLTPGVGLWYQDLHTLPRTFSDHSSVLLQLQVPRPEGFERQWRFPTRALLDDQFNEAVRAAIELYFELNTGSVTSWATLWEAFKAYIRGICISQHAGTLRDIRKSLQTLELRLAALDAPPPTVPSAINSHTRLSLLHEFRELADRETLYLSKYSAARKYGEGERPGRALAQLLRPPYSKAFITELSTTDGQTIHSTSEIRDTFLHYSSTLYTSGASSDLADQEAYLDDVDLTYLQKPMQEFLADPFSAEEIIIAIEALKATSASGLDGFTGEFYKTYKDLLAPKLLEVYDEALSKSSLPPTLREAVIILLPKPGKDPMHCASYRPLSLLNLDYKILAKMIALRLAQLMEHVVSPDSVRVCASQVHIP